MPWARKYLRPCARCGREAPMMAKQRFCSRDCGRRAQRVHEARLCVVCGLEYLPLNGRQRFCSRKCALIGRAPRTLECPRCHAMYQARSASQKFCSPQCANAWLRMHRPPGRRDTVDCVHCAKPFGSQGRRRRYCSKACRFAAQRARNPKTCEVCVAPFGAIDQRQRFCSKRCGVIGRWMNRGAAAYNWKGGRVAAARGYVKVRAPEHPRAKTNKHPYVLEHILVMEKMLGRYLAPNERVHHKNGDRGDNRPENLELWKVKDPLGVRAADYHCAGCRCDRGAMNAGPAVSEAKAEGHSRAA